MTLVAAPATATRRSAPVGTSERIHALDIIRGSALFGMILALFGCEALASRAWLARFSFGPLERVWRAATYGRLAP